MGEPGVDRMLLFLALAGARKAVVSFLLGGFFTVLLTVPATGNEFSPSSVAKGVLLVASPMLNDPNFRQAVCSSWSTGRREQPDSF
ncbi:hypothetical protein [Nitrospira sp. Nam80]